MEADKAEARKKHKWYQKCHANYKNIQYKIAQPVATCPSTLAIFYYHLNNINQIVNPKPQLPNNYIGTHKM